MKEALNIVWLKRDIRTQDHAPLFLAEQASIPYIIIYVFEPSIIRHPDISDRHLQFVYHSLQAVNQTLKAFDRLVHLLYGEIIEIFTALQSHYHINKLFSYQESGISLTWQRDKEVQKFCESNKINWQETPRDGIVRGRSNRDGWDAHWSKKMNSIIIKNKYSQSEIDTNKNFEKFKLPNDFLHILNKYPPQMQIPGEKYAWRYLQSFMKDRGVNYMRHISKPLESRISCARISPYLAWGNLSLKQAYQFVKNHPNRHNHKRAFNAFLTRLKWHCHFIQKFEDDCTYETNCLNSGFEILEKTKDQNKIDAWKKGQTGFPLVDANMICLKETGWINFRMRAMLVSFLCHQLDQDWRSGVYHLASYFLDYEPGIHYPQFQMQAGTTGINIIRMYNPVKQSKDHDPGGKFIKTWIPALRNLPDRLVHEPWKLTQMEESIYSCKIGIDYPLPLVNIEQSARQARDKIWKHKEHPLVQKENKAIIERHVRRKS